MILRLVVLLALVCASARAKDSAFNQRIKPFLKEYCYDCHADGAKKGDLSLDEWKSDAEALADRKTWERVMGVMERGEMPPKKKPQPSIADRHALVQWIEKDALQCDCNKPDPGRVTLRRLNRAEYNNTIRELLGIEFKPAKDFPVDDSGHGFDTIGDALSLPPLLMEKYFNAADRIIDAAFGLGGPPQAKTNRLSVNALELGYNAKQRGDGWASLNSVEEDDVATPMELITPAEFIVRVKAYSRMESKAPMQLTFMLDAKPLETVTVETNEANARVYETRFVAPAGEHRLRAVVRRDKTGLSEKDALRWKSGELQKGVVFVQWLEIEGPFPTQDFTRKLILPAEKDGKAAARKFVSDFTRRAFRRPATKEELNGLNQLMESAWTRGSSFQEGIGVAAKAALVSPHFLFRGELQKRPGDPQSVEKLDDYALASRLSYFLWSSMPDDELFREAEKITLRKNLDKQVRRLLADPRSRALVDNFAGQWLQFRTLSQLQPDEGSFNKFDEPLREAMGQETALLFETIQREDRSILEFLNADYTFLNERLAKHYQIENVKGPEFRRVSLQGTPRRGVITHASVLALTSNPTRTSPVKRGKWVLDNLLNAPPPPPPPDIPELKDGKELTGTLRERLEQHRENALCASCHARMDPIGFGLENFDGIGSWRDVEGKNTPIDSRGELTTGEKFSTPLELTQILANEKREQFLKCFVEKMMTYALGRGTEYYDRCAVNEIVASLQKNNYRFSEAILGVTRSAPFQLRRGDSGG